MARSGPNTTARRNEKSLSTLTDQAYELIRHQILHGYLKAGEIVSERSLSEGVKLGKAPIRVAVQRLASEGFVSIEARRGIIVSPRSIQDVLDHYEVRMELEKLVVRSLAGRLRPEQIEMLQANLAEHRAIAEKGVPVDTLAADFSFHRLLCTFHGNSTLRLMLNRIYDFLFPELKLSHEKSPDRVCQAVGEHEEIAKALIDGDAAEAERLIVAHLRCCQDFVMSRGARLGHS